MLLLLVYTILTPLQFYAVTRQKHPITRLLAAALTSQVVALLAISIHFLLFAWNGQGVPGLGNFGEVLEIFSQVCHRTLCSSFLWYNGDLKFEPTKFGDTHNLDF